MTYGLSDSQLEQIIEVFKNQTEIERVVLYGSRAKGNFKDYSDIDITLFGNELTLSNQQKIKIELDDLFLPYKFDVSLYVTIENEELLKHIKRVGVTIYSKEMT